MGHTLRQARMLSAALIRFSFSCVPQQALLGLLLHSACVQIKLDMIKTFSVPFDINAFSC